MVTAAGAGMVLLVVAACGGTSTQSGSASTTNFSALLVTENTQAQEELKSLANGACKSQNDALPLQIDQTPSANMQQKVQLLGGQGALPVLFQPTNSLITKDGALQKSRQVLNIEKTLTDLGVGDAITPAAKSTIGRLFNGESPTIPLQYNLEGIFYNKKIFAENNIAVPSTWPELVAAAAKLKQAGITPLTASGTTGWTITRWIGAYIVRDLGPDALQKVADGRAKLTDPQYVNAAQQIADLGKAGYFPQGITSLDYDTANSNLLTGKAAMEYMGTWMLANINDPQQNKVGNDIGFMPFPAVPGGAGSIDQYPTSVGSPIAVSAAAYTPKVGDWLKCIAQNSGSDAMKNQGLISGFKMNQPVPNIPPLTKDIQERADKATSTVLWFDALFNVKATSDAKANAAPLLTGSVSPSNFMTIVQTDLDTAR
jgi:raffinose/stachyose/melibiose transport system substrate-binding protein